MHEVCYQDILPKVIAAERPTRSTELDEVKDIDMATLHGTLAQFSPRSGADGHSTCELLYYHELNDYQWRQYWESDDEVGFML